MCGPTDAGGKLTRIGVRLQGEMLRAKAAEEATDMIEKERLARERGQRANWETARANDALRAFKLKEEERERAADLAIEVYAAKKTALLQERKRREAAREAAKEQRRQGMVSCPTCCEPVVCSHSLRP